MSKKFTRVISCILSAVLILSVLSTGFLSASAVGGSCGIGLTWSFNNESGILTVSGSGKMTDWDKVDAVPWNTYMGEIKSAVINSGVLNIGSFAFCFAGKLVSVSLPESVTAIGKSAFWDCSSLTEIALPKELKILGEGAFLECSKLTTVIIPGSVSLLESNSFAYCVRLTNATILCTVPNIPELLFAGCVNLTTISLPASLKSISKNAFLDCGSLSKVYYASDEYGWKQISISETGNSDLLGASLSVANVTQVNMIYRAVKTLSVPKDLIYLNSSNSNVVSISGSSIQANSTGSAIITVISEDGEAFIYNVNVTYTWWQLLIIYVLFGWAWY